MSTVTALRPRRIPTPATEPPFDDPEPRPRIAAPQNPLPLDFRSRPSRPRLQLVPGLEPDARAPGAAGLPPARQWAESVARGVAEILVGARPATQFRQCCTPEVFEKVGRRGALAAARAVTAPLRRAAPGAVHLCRPAAKVVEVVTVLHGLAHPKALAFRLEARGKRWVCTALELG